MANIYPNPVSVDVVGAKITGIKTSRINIFDAWKDKGVLLKQPFAKYEPPKNLDEIVKMGIIQDLTKQEQAVKQSTQNVQSDVMLGALVNLAKSKPTSSVGIPSAPAFAGGAMWGWGDVGNWLGGVGQTIENGLGAAGNAIAGAAGSAGNAITGAAGSAGNFIGDIGKIWNSLLHLADLVNDMYSFMQEWKNAWNNINGKLLNLTAANKALSETANRLIAENKQFYANMSKMMNEKLAEYFDNLTFNLLKYGQVEIPSAVVGALTLKIKNNTPMPVSVSIPDLAITSGGYTLHKGAYFVTALPMESDLGNLPFDVRGVDEARYIVNAKKEGGVLPITVTGTAITPLGKTHISISKTMKI